MNYRYILIFIGIFYLYACKEATKSNTDVGTKNEIKADSAVHSNNTNSIIDQCNNAFFSAVLENDKTKGSDTCILKINLIDKKKDQFELLHVPADMSSIDYCEKDYVAVGYACGGPCHSRVFVFTDHRKTQKFDYAQRIRNSTHLIAYIKNEDFEKLIVHNLENGKEAVIDIADNNAALNYGRMDTMYMKQNELFIKYPTTENKIIKKSIPLNEILK